MKAAIEYLLGEGIDPIRGRNLVREYLQARILESLQRSEAMIPLAFHGGTALRFLYAIPRYSEDLDFALERKEVGYDFHAYLQAIGEDLGREGYEVEIKLNNKRIVHSAYIRFHQLLYEFDLTGQRNEVVSVKIEVDTNPPAGAVLETTVIRRHVTLRLQHHDRASLFAGKLHAIFQRRYVKGRDLYDLMWYLSDPGWPSPNLVLLRNALAQTGWDGEMPDESNWQRLVAGYLNQIDFKKAAADVQPFLDRQQEKESLRWENFDKLLKL